MGVCSFISGHSFRFSILQRSGMTPRRFLFFFSTFCLFSARLESAAGRLPELPFPNSFSSESFSSLLCAAVCTAAHIFSNCYFSLGAWSCRLRPPFSYFCCVIFSVFDDELISQNPF